MLTKTDYIARYFAVFIFAPYIIYRGNEYKDNFLIFFGYLLLIYEIFCIFCYHPAKFKF